MGEGTEGTVTVTCNGSGWVSCPCPGMVWLCAECDTEPTFLERCDDWCDRCYQRPDAEHGGEA